PPPPRDEGPAPASMPRPGRPGGPGRRGAGGSTAVGVIVETSLIRWGLMAAVQQDARLELYGSGFDPRSALYGLERRPSVVLLGSGAGALSRLKETLRDVRTYFPRGPIVALSPHEVRSAADAFTVAESADADVILLNP